MKLIATRAGFTDNELNTALVRGDSVENFRVRALEKMKRSPARPLGEAERMPELEHRDQPEFGDVGLSQKDIQKYSLVRSIENFCKTKRWDGLEYEASRAAAQKYKLEDRGDTLHVPNEVFTAPYQQRGFSYGQRTLMQAGSFTNGGVLVENEMGSMIDKLRNEALAVQLGARTLSGLVGNSVNPTIAGDTTAYWASEGTAITETEPTLGQLILTPKRLGAYCRLTRKLTMQTSQDIESLVRDNVAKVMAVAIDLAIINGTGNAQPVGIMGTTGINTVTFSGAATWAKILSFETELATDNVRPVRPGWLTTPAVRAKWKAIQRFTSTDTPLWTDANTVNGYAAHATNQVPSDKVIFADWNDVYVGNWAGGFSVIVDPYTEANKGIVALTVEQYADVGLGHAESACVSTDTGAA
jgi:HK97 family phage major capsid protein